MTFTLTLERQLFHSARASTSLLTSSSSKMGALQTTTRWHSTTRLLLKVTKMRPTVCSGGEGKGFRQ